MLTGVLARYQRRLLMLDPPYHSRAFRHAIRPHEREYSRRIPNRQLIGALQLYMRPGISVIEEQLTYADDITILLV